MEASSGAEERNERRPPTFESQAWSGVSVSAIGAVSGLTKLTPEQFQFGQACARFLAPDFILSMLVQVGRGETGTIGEPI